MSYDATVALIKPSAPPLPPPMAYAGAIAVEVGCGLLMILGYQTRIVASIFARFRFATAIFFHARLSDPNQTFHFIKNIIIAGGLLQIVANGAGAISIDNRLFKKAWMARQKSAASSILTGSRVEVSDNGHDRR